MTSIMGTNTLVCDSRIRASKGSIQPMFASQCASKKTRTSPLAKRAPAKRARINPNLVEKMNENLMLSHFLQFKYIPFMSFTSAHHFQKF